MKRKQRTVRGDVALSGVGLHTGCQTNITIKPADADAGINFIRVDLPNQPLIKAEPGNVTGDTDIARCTTIGASGAVVHTVEHLMGTLSGLGITNATVEIDNEELPGLDGSGLEYLKAIKAAGIEEQEAEAEIFEIQEPVGVEANGSSIFIVPSNEFRISYTLDYNHPILRSQFFSAAVDQDLFESDIAPCRTFCLEPEVEKLRQQGLGKGASYDNTLVVGDDGVKNNTLRFNDEFARHKVLDFIGDLYLLGVPIQGKVFAVKSGHYLNFQLLKKLHQQRCDFQRKQLIQTQDFSGCKEISIGQVMDILPHRYPFLLVDRVFEVEPGKSGIGLKNVTINDQFFRGHFPTRPIMPGVLMIEAMAQTAGVIVLTSPQHRGKLAFFLAVDNVKFRQVVTPGDQLVMHIEVIRDRSKTAQIRGIAKVDGKVAAEADMVFSFTDASYLDE